MPMPFKLLELANSPCNCTLGIQTKLTESSNFALCGNMLSRAFNSTHFDWSSDGLALLEKKSCLSITKLLLNDMSNMKVRLCSYMSAPIPLGKQRTDIHLDSIIRTNYSNPHECYMSACNFRSNKIQLILSKIFAIESSNYYMMIKFFGSIWANNNVLRRCIWINLKVERLSPRVGTKCSKTVSSL